MTGELKVKRAYVEAESSDGQRILVDGLWPRGVARDRLRLSAWMKELAPSEGLRRWFGHDPERWEEFRRRYSAELDEKPDAVEALRAFAAKDTVTLIYGAKDESHNNAVALRAYLKPHR